MARPFRDRTDAGRQLAEQLTTYTDRPDVIVLALPRGGVPVAYEVAQALNVPLDIFLVRKLGLPVQEELAMGAIAANGVTVLNSEVVDTLRIPDEVIEQVAAREQRELPRRERLYRGDRPMPRAGVIAVARRHRRTGGSRAPFGHRHQSGNHGYQRHGLSPCL